MNHKGNSGLYRAKLNHLARTCLIVCVLGALSGCYSSASTTRKEVFNYQTYTCEELLEEKSFWLERLDHATSDQAADQQRADTVAQEQSIVGLLGSMAGEPTAGRNDQLAYRAKYHVALIDAQRLKSRCQ